MNDERLNRYRRILVEAERLHSRRGQFLDGADMARLRRAAGAGKTGEIGRCAGAAKALEPLADHRPAALTLVNEILTALGRFLAENSNASLTALRCAAAATLMNLRPPDEPRPPDDAELLNTLRLEAPAMVPLRRAARMILELWEFADQLRQSPETSPGELIHVNGWGSPATEKILCKLALGCAFGELVSDGRGGVVMRAFRAPAAHRGRRRSGRRAAKGGRGE